jgi:hypothetical protein
MKTKIGTALDPELLRRARSIATREGKRLNQVIEEALAELVSRRSSTAASRAVARTAGCLKLPKSTVSRLLREEPGILGR